MKKGVVIGTIAVIVVLVLVFVFFIHDPTDTNSYSDSDNLIPGEQEAGGVQGGGIESGSSGNQDCDIEFTEYLIDPMYVQKVGQIGVVHGGGKSIVERSYISIKQEFIGEKIPIYAPTDMTLVSGSKYKMPGSSDAYIPDYVLKFELGCQVELVLGHLKDVVPSIGAQIYEIKQDSREINIRPIEFKAGELIAYYIQQEQGVGVGGFDFIVRDRKITNQFLNQPRYDAGMSYNLRTGMCPYDYYTGEKKEAYYNLFGGAGGTLFKVKSCGTASRDKAGTISGMWFLDKEIVGTIYDNYMDGDYGSPISIVGDEERVNFGNFGQTPVNWVYANDPTYKLPEEVTDEHCYQFGGGGYAYFKVVDDMTMDVYYSPSGTCPSDFPDGEGKRYYK